MEEKTTEGKEEATKGKGKVTKGKPLRVKLRLNKERKGSPEDKRKAGVASGLQELDTLCKWTIKRVQKPKKS